MGLPLRKLTGFSAFRWVVYDGVMTEICEKTALAYFKVLSLHLSGGFESVNPSEGSLQPGGNSNPGLPQHEIWGRKWQLGSHKP
jgi:hypothetical protein